MRIFKEDSDVVIAPAFIGNSKDLTDHQTKKIDIEEESSFSEETLPNKRRRKSLDKLKSFGFISAVIIGLLLITILVLLADKITGKFLLQILFIYKRYFVYYDHKRTHPSFFRNPVV